MESEAEEEEAGCSGDVDDDQKTSTLSIWFFRMEKEGRRSE